MLDRCCATESAGSVIPGPHTTSYRFLRHFPYLVCLPTRINKLGVSQLPHLPCWPPFLFFLFPPPSPPPLRRFSSVFLYFAWLFPAILIIKDSHSHLFPLPFLFFFSPSCAVLVVKFCPTSFCFSGVLHNPALYTFSRIIPFPPPDISLALIFLFHPIRASLLICLSALHPRSFFFILKTWLQRANFCLNIRAAFSARRSLLQNLSPLALHAYMPFLSYTSFARVQPPSFSHRTLFNLDRSTAFRLQSLRPLREFLNSASFNFIIFLFH